MKITKERAMKLMEAHGMSSIDYDCFFKELGNKPMYSLKAVKSFLGY